MLSTKSTLDVFIYFITSVVNITIHHTVSFLVQKIYHCAEFICSAITTAYDNKLYTYILFSTVMRPSKFDASITQTSINYFKFEHLLQILEDRSLRTVKW